MNIPNRQSIRLPDYDYSASGDYFITICIQNRECLLGQVENDLMVLNEYGLLVAEIWKDLPNHYSSLQLGAWMVMPNHVHGVLILTGVGAIHESPACEKAIGVGAIHESPAYEKAIGVGAIHESPACEKAIGVGAIHESPAYEKAIHERAIHESPLRDKRRKMLLSKIIGRFKMTTGKQINLLRETPGTAVWQRNYYEHVIRNDEAFVNIKNYILNNPASWDTDKENVNRINS